MNEVPDTIKPDLEAIFTLLQPHPEKGSDRARIAPGDQIMSVQMSEIIVQSERFMHIVWNAEKNGLG